MWKLRDRPTIREESPERAASKERVASMGFEAQ